MKQQVSWAGGSTPSHALSTNHNSLAEPSRLVSQNRLMSGSKDIPGYSVENPDLRHHMLAGYTEEGESMDQSDLVADLDVRMELYTDKADWNDTSIVTYVLQFLLVTGHRCCGVSGGSGSTTTVDAPATSKQLEDATSYRLVSKAWALGSYRLLAHHLAHAENSPTFRWPRWAKFVSKFSWGRFLSSGM